MTTAVAPEVTHGLRLSFSVLVEPDGDGFYAHCPTFKGIHVDGKTEDEAFNHAVEAVRCYLFSLARHGEPIPVGAELVNEYGTAKPHPRVHSRRYEVQWPSLQAHGIS